jgi:predicted HTH domain antitoxin
MKSVQAVIEVPEDIYEALSARGFSKTRISEQSRRLLSLKYYQDRILTLGKAAQFAGVSKWEFMEFLSRNGVPVIVHDQINLDREAESVESLTEELQG